MTIIGISPVPAVDRTADTLQLQLPAYLTNQLSAVAEQARPAASLSGYPMDRLSAIIDDPTLTAEKKIALVRGLRIQTMFEQGHSVAEALATAGFPVTEDEALELVVDIIAYETGWLRGVGLRPETDQSNR